MNIPREREFKVVNREVRKLTSTDPTFLGGDSWYCIGIIRGDLQYYCVILDIRINEIRIEEIVNFGSSAKVRIADIELGNKALVQVQDDEEWAAIVTWARLHTDLLSKARLQNIVEHMLPAKYRFNTTKLNRAGIPIIGLRHKDALGKEVNSLFDKLKERIYVNPRRPIGSDVQEDERS